MSTVSLVQLRVERAEAAAWRQAARQEDRSVAAFVRVAVRERLARQQSSTSRTDTPTDTAAYD